MAAFFCYAAVFEDQHLMPGAHINGVGSYTPAMQEIPPQTVERSALFVDSRSAALSEAGDIILSIDRRPITMSSQLRSQVASMPPGRTVDLTVLRGDRTLDLPITLGELPDDLDELPFHTVRRGRTGEVEAVVDVGSPDAPDGPDAEAVVGFARWSVAEAPPANEPTTVTSASTVSSDNPAWATLPKLSEPKLLPKVALKRVPTEKMSKSPSRFSGVPANSPPFEATSRDLSASGILLSIKKTEVLPIGEVVRICQPLICKSGWFRATSSSLRSAPGWLRREGSSCSSTASWPTTTGRSGSRSGPRWRACWTSSSGCSGSRPASPSTAGEPRFTDQRLCDEQHARNSGAR